MNYYNYFTEIEETFIRRRGKNLILSPLDWALIEAWQEREIPLHIVLGGIEKVFDGVDAQPGRKRSVKSLSYCKEEIEAKYAEWLEMQVGKNGDSATAEAAENSVFSDETMTAHLQQISAALEDAGQKAAAGLRETLERVVQRLAELEKTFASTEQLEEALGNLDQLIDESLLQNSETKQLNAEVEGQLASYRGKMERDVYEKTFDLMLRKRLRDDAQIPRLSLFYL